MKLLRNCLLALFLISGLSAVYAQSSASIQNPGGVTNGTITPANANGVLACGSQAGSDIVAKCNSTAFLIQGGLQGAASGTVLINPATYTNVATQLDGVDNVVFMANGVTLTYATSYTGKGMYWRNVGHGGVRGNIKLNGPGSVLAVPGTPSLSTNTVGGSLPAATSICVKNTFISSITDSVGGNTGETTVSAESCIVTGAGATNIVTVTAPALPTGAQGYTVYSGPTGAELQQAASNACVNIATNCVIQIVGAGAAAPSTNTAIHPSICIQLGIGSGGANADTVDNIFDHVQCNNWGRMLVGEGSVNNGTYGNTFQVISGGEGVGKANGIGLYIVPTGSNDFNKNTFFDTNLVASVGDCVRGDGANGIKLWGLRCESGTAWGVNFLGTRATNNWDIHANWDESNTLGDFRCGSAVNVTNMTITGGPQFSSPTFSANCSAAGTGNTIVTPNLSMVGGVLLLQASDLTMFRAGANIVGFGTNAAVNSAAGLWAGAISQTADLNSTMHARMDTTGLSVGSADVIGSSSTAAANGSKDIAFSRIAVGTFALGNGTNGNKTGLFQSGMTARLASDFTDANASGLQVITGLAIALPNLAANWSFHCSLTYSEATPIANDQFGVASLTTSPTNLHAWAHVITTEGATAAQTTGDSGNIANTTPTAIVTFTPVGTGIKQAEIDGSIEAAGGGASTLQFYVTNGTAADVIVIKRDSYCAVTP